MWTAIYAQCNPATCKYSILQFLVGWCSTDAPWARERAPLHQGVAAPMQEGLPVLCPKHITMAR